MTQAKDTTLADPEKLRAFASAALQKAGVAAKDADLTANLLVLADLRGMDSHGVARLAEYYVDRIRDGRVNPEPTITVTRGGTSTATVDGGAGLGFVVGDRAMREAIVMAEDTGSGWVSVRNSTHFGMTACYALMALEHDMIGFSFTTSGALAAVPGGSGRRIGINAMSIAAPGGQHGPYVLDMASSVTAMGKIEVALREGKPLPVGWAVDHAGKPITDAATFFEEGGAILPLGGSIDLGAYKGLGIAMLADILAGMLSGGGHSIVERGGAYAHAFGALRISGFPSPVAFRTLMDDMIEKLHASATVEGADPVMYPGERENRCEAERTRNGIPLNAVVESDLRALGAELGVPFEVS